MERAYAATILKLLAILGAHGDNTHFFALPIYGEGGPPKAVGGAFTDGKEHFAIHK
jgi:hypothetical protein